MRVFGRLFGVVWVVVLVLGCSDNDGCPEGSKLQNVCTECGPAGGCAKRTDTCTRICKEAADCDGGFVCIEGVCQVGYCE